MAKQDDHWRRQAKRQYKETHQPAGVFELRNTKSGKVLLGSSPNLPAMFNRMRMQLDTGTYLMHPELQRDWHELGGDAFEFSVLEELDPPDAPTWNSEEDRDALLELWLEKRRPFGEAGYNREPGSGAQP